MHQRERRLHPLVGQVGEELAELGGREHPLVDEGARRERREVDRAAQLGVGRTELPVDHLVLAALAHHEQLAVEVDARRSAGICDEHVAELRDHAPGRRPDHRVVDGHVAPPHDPEALLRHDLLDAVDGLLGVGGVEREEGEAHAVRARRRERRSRPSP